jgi:hypothetical protein
MRLLAFSTEKAEDQRAPQKRRGDKLADPEHITALYQQLSSLGALERHVLRTEGQGPQEMLSAASAAVRGDGFRLSA